ncbi:hypothetical protein B5X24_HaOG201948 [Helicoverpa armigera]|uniref:Ubiquitin fusion degradation protein 1 n=1 Tax=Helicoverpa armigera TaxID=29058 RepID=A0A2W1BUI0_HELAM|nr:hypothetical protein B5X24_HaOG201948 [Helicoverpa armigera]
MPPSALEQLTRLNIEYPMIFKLTNKKTKRITHCGVLEFVADEGRVYLPHWMMTNLVVEEGALLQIESVSLPVATFSKFQPLSEDFLDITNPKAVLENCLRNFSCLTTGDVIAIKYNSKVYELCVLETKPGNAVIIIECDMNPYVRGIPDYDYVIGTLRFIRNSRPPSAKEETPSEPFTAFKGEGFTLRTAKSKN